MCIKCLKPFDLVNERRYILRRSLELYLLAERSSIQSIYEISLHEDTQ